MLGRLSKLIHLVIGKVECKSTNFYGSCFSVLFEFMPPQLDFKFQTDRGLCLAVCLPLNVCSSR